MVDEHPNTELFWLLADVAITCCILNLDLLFL